MSASTDPDTTRRDAGTSCNAHQFAARAIFLVWSEVATVVRSISNGCAIGDEAAVNQRGVSEGKFLELMLPEDRVLEYLRKGT